MADFYSNTSVIYRLRLNMTVASQSTANNTSTINYQLNLEANGSSSYAISCSSGVSPFNLTINGQKLLNNYQPAISIRGGQTIGIKAGSITVPHNSDGTKTISFSFSYNYNISGAYAPGALSASSSWALPNIARASGVSINKKDFTIGDTMTITIAPAASGYTHTIWASWYGSETGGQNPTIVSKTSNTSVTWTLPASLADALPNSTSGWGTIFCDTYSGNTCIGTSSATFTVSIPSSVVPTISSLTIGEATANLATKFGAYIQTKSTLSCKVTASGANNSTITSIVTTIEGRSYTGSSFTSGAIQGSGTIPVKTVVTDSRGRTATKTVNATVLAYSSPKITVSNVNRCNSSGTVTEDGTYLLSTYNYSITSLNNKNTKTFKIEWLNGSTWTSLYSNTSSYTGNSTNKSSSGSFSADKTYSIRFTATDYFGSTTVTKTISPSFSIINFGAGGRSMAVGKVSGDAGKLEVALPTDFTGLVDTENFRIANIRTRYMGRSFNINCRSDSTSGTAGNMWFNWATAPADTEATTTYHFGASASGGYGTIIANAFQKGDGSRYVYSSADNIYRINIQSNSSKTYLEISKNSAVYGADIWNSDARLKNTILPSDKNALEEIKKVKTYQFNWNDSGAHVDCGFISQQLQDVNPDFVFEVGEGEEKTLQPTVQGIVPVLTKAVQDLSEIVEKQNKKIEELERRITDLENS